MQHEERQRRARMPYCDGRRHLLRSVVTPSILKSLLRMLHFNGIFLFF